MGEEAKPEQPQAEAKAEEQPVEEKKEETPPPPPPEEEPKEQEPPQPPPPFVLYVDLHCVGCAKKIERSIMKIRGVEGVVTDMAKKVTIKGVLEPQAVCNMITKKTKRKAKVLSPLPTNEGESIPEVITSQVSGLMTVELNVNMHCEACAEQLKKKILKMRGVQNAETEFSTGMVKVTGTMDADKLVDYLYRRTKKQARIVPQPEPENPPEEPKPEPEKPAEEPKPKPEKPEPKEGGGENDQKPPAEEAPKGEGGEMKEAPAPPPPPQAEEGGGDGGMVAAEEAMKRMVYYPRQYYEEPFYYIERIPPPQLFSDENPNACCIS